jgi:hypothetical protein
VQPDRGGLLIYLVLVLVIVGTGVLTARAARHRGGRIQSLTTTIVRVGGLIALIRLGLFWGGLALYTGPDGWGQVVGYGLLIGNAFVELAIAASWFGGPGPPLLVAALIALTSVMLGFVWAWIRFRPSFKRAA